VACFPYSFIWYYFERVKSGKHLSRSLLP
jgi:hypothetical protein